MDESWTTIDGPNDLRLGEVMPAWFAGRMLADEWKFGLLLSTGQTMLISRIEAVHLAPGGQVLLDVEMLLEAEGVVAPGPVLMAPAGRPRATVNLAHVVAAFEVAGAPGEEGPG
ncbi:hypothetical protein CR162_13385 [Pseudoroseomonas rhizosphaerae]|uniref:Uncharacterized protein n=1 Tax=Teichococcus rhizosphaerae TaxID=1335062 RepID=A0A2C7ACU4_9PROT|nr:hypothetical protein [Pseudoroseomonas rhizosphaerae]PHK94477.1 hypothetical protein CR162_13385 [Pseudoroseomonas rhizosphaerae]